MRSSGEVLTLTNPVFEILKLSFLAPLSVQLWAFLIMMIDDKQNNRLAHIDVYMLTALRKCAVSLFHIYISSKW